MKNFWKWLFRGSELPGADTLSAGILFFRIFAGAMMIPYGWSKIVRYDEFMVNFFEDPIGIGMAASLYLTIFAQVVCAVTLILGLQTRLSAIVLAFNMVVAVKYHFFDPFTVKAFPLLFLGMYIALIISGGGKYSLDGLIFKNSKEKKDPQKDPDTRRRVWLMALAFVLFWIAFANCFSGGMSLAILSVAALLVFGSVAGVHRD